MLHTTTATAINTINAEESKSLYSFHSVHGRSKFIYQLEIECMTSLLVVYEVKNNTDPIDAPFIRMTGQQIENLYKHFLLEESFSSKAFPQNRFSFKKKTSKVKCFKVYCDDGNQIELHSADILSIYTYYKQHRDEIIHADAAFKSARSVCRF
jgi:hypothetical protein